MLRYILLFILFALPTAAFPEDAAGFPPQTVVEGRQIKLNGTGIRKATILRVKVYEAALYLTAPVKDAQAAIEEKGPKQLLMRFLRDVTEEKVVSTWKESLIANNKDSAAWLPKLEALTKGIGEVKEGELLTLTVTDDGAKLETDNGYSKEVQAPGFASALLRIWLGEAPPDEDLKNGLLGAGS